MMKSRGLERTLEELNWQIKTQEYIDEYQLDEEELVWGSLQPEGGELEWLTLHKMALTHH